jgi:hypothetical protein
MKRALPAPTSPAAEALFIAEKTKRERTNSDNFLANGLQGIIDTIDAEKCG